MKLFGMCIDKRVVAGVIAAAGLLWWLAPGAVVTALPFLVFAICPLSMMLMMKAMNRTDGQQQHVQQDVAPQPAPPNLDVAALTAAADLDARRN